MYSLLPARNALFRIEVFVFQVLIFYRPYRDQRYDVAVQLQTFGSFRSLGCKATGKSLEQRINEKQENIKTNIGKQYQRLCDRSLRLKSSPSVIASSMRVVGHTDASEKTVCMCLSFKGLISVDVGNDDPMSIASIEKILQMELAATFGMDV